jgi:hypothetical protein
MKCGDNINICPSAPWEKKKVRFFERKVLSSPSKIRWHWGDNNWQEIEGDDYQVSVGYSSNASGYAYGTFWGMGGYAPSGCKVLCYWMSSEVLAIPIRGIYYSSYYILDKNNIVRRPFPCTKNNYDLNLNNYSSYSYIYYNAGPNCEESGGIYRGKDLIVTKYKLIQGSSFFVLKIFDNSQLVHEENNSNNPTVEEIPPSCYYEDNLTNLFTIDGTKIGLTDVRIQTYNDGQGDYRAIEVVSLNPLGLPITLRKYQTNISGCELTPMICYECIEDDPCTKEKCPPGTHCKILMPDGNLVCYAADGCPIHHFKYNPNCHKYDVKC